MGVEFKRYLFEYRHEGSEWGIEIIAKSPEDARERLKALSWARYQGEIKATVPMPSVWPLLGVVTRLTTAIRTAAIRIAR